MVLKELILTVSIFGGCGDLQITDFNSSIFGICGGPEGNNF